jgi:hypothetical protein
MVFIGHGIVTAFYMMMAVVAAAALWRARIRVARASPAAVTAYLGVVLVLCNSLAALVYAIVLVPLVRLTKPRLQLGVAVILAIVALSYPFTRMTDLVPTRALLDWSASYNADREESLGFRFAQEGHLLERASQRFIFGWGGYGRSRLYETETGKDTSVTDGEWIIALGVLGLFGFVAEFGLLILPVFRAATALHLIESTRDRIFLAALALMLAVSVVDLIPNATITPWTWLICGALLGRTEALRAAIGRPKKTVPLSAGKSLRRPTSALANDGPVAARMIS